MPGTREDEIVVGRLDVAKIPSNVGSRIWGTVGEGLLLQYAVYRASSLFGITCYATCKMGDRDDSVNTFLAMGIV